MNTLGLLYFAAAYLIGAIPFALLIGRLKGIDLRQQGSGNLGATNVFRTLGAPYGVLVFLLDSSKGFIPTYMAMQAFQNPWWHVAIGCMAVFGHAMSLFVRFKGGKGVATGLGMLLALSPLLAGAVFVVVIGLIAITRIVSIGSLLGCVLMPLLFYVCQEPLEYTTVVTLLSCFIIWRHKPNIQRLLEGKEHKING